MAITDLIYLAESISSFSSGVKYFPVSNLIERPIPAGQLQKNQVGHRYEILGTSPVKNSAMTLQTSANLNAVGAATKLMSTLHVPVLTYLNSIEREAANPLKVDYCIVSVQVVAPSLAFDNTSVGYLSSAIDATAHALTVYDDGSPATDAAVLKRMLRGGTSLV